MAKAKKALKKNMTIDDLAMMVARGFESADNHLSNFRGEVNDKFEVVESRLGSLEKGQQKLHQDVLNIGDRFVPRYEFDNLLIRFSRLEQKVNGKHK